MSAGLVLDLDSPVPIFQQIADGLRAAVARGVFGPGDLLPSVRSLAEELGVNPNTVQRAFGALEREGLVTSERGRGMAVQTGVRAAARAGGEDAVLGRLFDAVRHARAVGMSDERFAALLKRAQRMAGPGPQEAGDGR